MSVAEIAKRMNLNHVIRLGGLPLGKLCRSMLLPLLLLVAQHGALLHELSHYASGAAQEDGEEKQPKAKHCDLCVAFARVSSIATTDVALPTLRVGLSFRQVPAASIAVAETERPSQRNRGPPTFL
jgi:hypothetical protein